MSSIYSNDSSIGDGDVIGDALTVSNGLAVVREIAMVPSLLPSPWPLSLPSPSHHYHFILVCPHHHKNSKMNYPSCHYRHSRQWAFSAHSLLLNCRTALTMEWLMTFFQRYILRKFEELYIVMQVYFFSSFLFLRTFFSWYLYECLLALHLGRIRLSFAFADSKNANFRFRARDFKMLRFWQD